MTVCACVCDSMWVGVNDMECELFCVWQGSLGYLHQCLFLLT